MMPISDINDDRLIFLEKFAHWLEIWKDDAQQVNKLTKDTFGSLIFSSKSLIQLTLYLLDEVKMKYVLTRKLQTDCLESRFGQYRQNSGGNYHI